MPKPRVGISACLLGHPVRYDGMGRQSGFLVSLSNVIDWVPVCPEVDAGLGTPRPPMRLEAAGGEEEPGLVVIDTLEDMTDVFNKWIHDRLGQLREEGLCGFIFKSRSPSCGLTGVEVFHKDGSTSPEMGLFARAFIKEFPGIPTGDDERLLVPQRAKAFFRDVTRCSGYGNDTALMEAIEKALGNFGDK